MARADRGKVPLTIPGLSSDSARFLEDLQKETDRGVALVAAAFLDNVLDAMLRTAFVDRRNVVQRLLVYPGPVSSFAARCDLAYCMGQIGEKMYADLHAVRDIRNTFGHSHTPASFDAPSIRAKCEQIRAADIVGDMGPVKPRYRFILGVTMLASQLLLRGLALKHAEVGADFKPMRWDEDDRRRFRSRLGL